MLEVNVTCDVLTLGLPNALRGSMRAYALRELEHLLKTQPAVKVKLGEPTELWLREIKDRKPQQ